MPGLLSHFLPLQTTFENHAHHYPEVTRWVWSISTWYGVGSKWWAAFTRLSLSRWHLLEFNGESHLPEHKEILRSLWIARLFADPNSSMPSVNKKHGFPKSLAMLPMYIRNSCVSDAPGCIAISCLIESSWLLPLKNYCTDFVLPRFSLFGTSVENAAFHFCLPCTSVSLGSLFYLST